MPGMGAPTSRAWSRRRPMSLDISLVGNCAGNSFFLAMASLRLWLLGHEDQVRQGVDQHVAVHAGAHAVGQALRQRRGAHGHDAVDDELGDRALADRAGVHRLAPEHVQDGRGRLHVGALPTRQEDEFALFRLRRAAGHGRLDVADLTLARRLPERAGGAGRYGAEVDHQLTLTGSLQRAVGGLGGRFQRRVVGHADQDRVDLLRQRLCAGHHPEAVHLALRVRGVAGDD